MSYGGKADHLIRLKNSGFAVPEFFLIREESKESDLHDLTRYFVEEGAAYAVRSSSFAEDQADTAMAGLFDTYLYVPASDLEYRINAVFSSARSQRSQAFLKARGLDPKIEMTVIVQNMIQSELSGVLFTVNPQGILNEFMAVAGYGTGNLVVEDQVPVTTLIHHEQDDLDIIRKEPGAPELSASLILKLKELAQALKREFSRPMDAEFALSGGKLWLLQARPITTLTASYETILDNSNISESYPGITLPLSIDFAKAAYAGIFHGLMAGILTEETACSLDPVLQEMVIASSGRMYYQINNWYRVMKLLPFSGIYIPIWQEMMGVSNREVEAIGLKLNPIKKLWGMGRFLKIFRKTPVQMELLDREFQRFRQYFWQVMDQEPDRERLIGLFEEMKSALLDQWDVTLINDLHAFIYTSAFKKLAGRKHQQIHPKHRKSLQDQPEDNPAGINGEDLNRMLSRIGELESMKPVQLLKRIAKAAPADFLRLEAEAEIIAYLRQKHPYSELLQDYITEYGDRYLEELKLESKTFRTDPKLLSDTIRDLRREDRVQQAVDINQEANDRKGKQTTEERPEEKQYSFLLKRAVRGIRNREISRLNRTRIFGMARELFLRLGEMLKNEGCIESARDVFWLRLKEALSTTGTDLRQTVRQRKRLYARFEELPVFTRLVFSGPPFDRTLPEKEGETEVARGSLGQDILFGTGASPGSVRGRVLIVESPGEAPEAYGRILVARQTDPGWVFLLASCAGLITERGSLLSHTAIISRELGKPAVVGLKNAVNSFRNGEWVELNGSTGEVRRIESDGQEQ